MNAPRPWRRCWRSESVATLELFATSRRNNPDGARCAKESSFGIDRFEFSDCVTDLNRYTSAHLSAVDRVLSQFFLNPQKLIVFGDAVGATERTGLYLPGVRGYGDVRDRRVLGFA